jgi:hypothetical protein
MFTEHLDTYVHIEAPPEAVIDRLCDGENIGSWSTFTRRLAVLAGAGPDGCIAKGSVLDLQMDAAGDGQTMEFKPRVLVRSPRELRWVGVLGIELLFRGEHFFIATPGANGGTDLHHGEVFTGAIIPYFRMKLLEGTRQGFERQNEELKKSFET